MESASPRSNHSNATLSKRQTNMMTATLSAGDIFWLCCLAGALGIFVVCAVVWFGTRLFWLDVETFARYWVRHNSEPYRSALGLGEVLQSRNEFWITYGQVILSTLIIVVLAILLLTHTITAEAGLPLLSAVSGFAIAKGVSTSRSAPTPPERESPRG